MPLKSVAMLLLGGLEWFIENYIVATNLLLGCSELPGHWNAMQFLNVPSSIYYTAMPLLRRWHAVARVFWVLMFAFVKMENIQKHTCILTSYIYIYIYTHTHIHIHIYIHTYIHTHTHTHTHVRFCEKWGHPIGVMVFILYKLYVLLPYTYPIPKLSPHRRLCISTFPKKTSLCMIYKRFEKWGHGSMSWKVTFTL